MKVIEIQARCREIIANASDAEQARELETELRERFIDYVAKARIPVVSLKAQMVLSTRHVTHGRGI